MSEPRLPALALCGSACTGGPAFAVAVRSATGVIEVASAPGERIDLAVLVQRACEAASVRVQDLVELRVDRGPGSYTGLRVAVTFARFLHRFGGASLLATSSLALMAVAADRGDGRALRPVLDGRRGRLHTAVFATDGAAVRRETRAPAALTVDELVAELHAGEVLLASPALHAQLASPVATAKAELIAPSPITAALLFDARVPIAPITAAELEPLYLMGSYAE